MFDRQYSPLIFRYLEQTIIPAESVYAVFEAKQTANAGLVRYARKKAASVRRLHRTSLPIPHASGTSSPRPLPTILGGLLTFESEWNPPLGPALVDALGGGNDDDRLDLGCIAAHGIFCRNAAGGYNFKPKGKPATAFLLELIAQLHRTPRCL